jgi:hypothetical protein
MFSFDTSIFILEALLGVATTDLSRKLDWF